MKNAIASLFAAAVLVSLPTPAHANPVVSGEPVQLGTLCPSADTTETFCVYDIPRAPDAPTFFIRKNGTKVTISHERAARKLTRWGYVLNEHHFWVKAD